MVQKLTELVISVFEAHDIQVSKLPPKEAEDDNQEFELQRRRARRGQRKLRLKLLELYNCKCAITGYAPTEVLEAAHIISHSISGVNHSDNGLLLRADIHSLFDLNLLRINPENFAVVIDSSLKTTPYWKLNGQQLRKRIDGGYPSKECLKQKWFGETI
nr:HNH endonuclease signature motif containing protein [Vibrio parahaemolyticus]